MTPLKHPILFIKSSEPTVIHAAHTVIQHLCHLKTSFSLTQETATILNDPYPDRVIDLAHLDQAGCDNLIVIGGDGSLLSAASTAGQHHLPVIGINLGSVGFLTDVMPTDLRTLTDMLAGQYQTESRHFIEVSINQGLSQLALNDVVLSRHAARLLDFEVFINQEFICSQRADGLIISTPTGSTAYALSAGGPIIHPELQALSLVSLCPHRLNSRPIIVPANKQIDIYLANEKSQNDALISCDGIALDQAGIQQASIAQASQCLTLLHPMHYQYFEALKCKLHWERTPTLPE